MKTIFISGGSRGIGLAIALRMAKEKYNVVIAAKTTEPNDRLEGTIYTAAQEIEKAGGKALPLVVDIRDEEKVVSAIETAVKTFGGIDILLNNASAINLSDTETLPMKHYDLMSNINVRGTFMVSKYAIPHLKKAINPHILTLSPPIDMNPKWFKRHLGYTMAKYGMSMTVIGLSEELRKHGIAVNALWPRTTIATAAVQNLLGGNTMVQKSRNASIVADAAYAIFSKDSKSCTGNFFIDEEVLQNEGISDFSPYAINPNEELMIDLFL